MTSPHTTAMMVQVAKYGLKMDNFLTFLKSFLCFTNKQQHVDSASKGQAVLCACLIH